jgi:hypothetical protein
MSKSLLKGLKEASEGKVKTYKSMDEFFAHIDEEKRLHPIKDFFFTLRCKLELYFIYNPRELWQDIIAFFQRGKNGFAHKDTWSLYYYLAKVIKDSLIHFKNTQSGYPATYNPEIGEYDLNKERWDEILDKMINTFHTQELINNGQYIYIHSDEWTYEKYFETIKYYKDVDPDCIVMNLDDVERFESGIKLFFKYFRALWS